MNPTCADCKNWNPDGRCASGTPTAEPWRRRNRVTPGLTGTIIPATECPAFDALVPARKPTKPRPTKIPLRYRRFSPAGCTSPATAAAAVATEATRVLEPLALDGEGIADVVGRLRDGARTRDDALDMIRDAHSALDTMPASSAPECVTPAQRIRYAAHAWLAEREEASRLATLCQDAHDALNEIGAPSPGTPAERIRAAVAALVRARDAAVVEATEARVERDRAQGKVDRVIRDLNAAWVEHALVVEERDTARSERDQARRAAEEATAVLGHAHQQLGVVGVPGGLLADRIRGLAEQRNQADEERSALRSRLDLALKRIHDERGIVFVAVLLLCAMLTAAILVALDVIPTLSVA